MRTTWSPRSGRPASGVSLIIVVIFIVILSGAAGAMFLRRPVHCALSLVLALGPWPVWPALSAAPPWQWALLLAVGALGTTGHLLLILFSTGGLFLLEYGGIGYVAGPLEDWTRGALALNGRDQYAVCPDRTLSQSLPYTAIQGDKLRLEVAGLDRLRIGRRGERCEAQGCDQGGEGAHGGRFLA